MISSRLSMSSALASMTTANFQLSRSTPPTVTSHFSINLLTLASGASRLFSCRVMSLGLRFAAYGGSCKASLAQPRRQLCLALLMACALRAASAAATSSALGGSAAGAGGVAEGAGAEAEAAVAAAVSFALACLATSAAALAMVAALEAAFTALAASRSEGVGEAMSSISVLERRDLDFGLAFPALVGFGSRETWKESAN